MWLGVIYPEHSIPAGAQLANIKLCECCGFLFVRRNQDKHCRKCHANPLPLAGGPITLEILESLAEEQPIAQ